MDASRKFRFAVQLTGPAEGRSWAETARRAEDLGFSTLFTPDHFNDQLAPMPALMAAASATTSLRVGALVWGVDYRHPVVLAKEAATIDLLSGGRLEFGLGAGWMSADYAQAGIHEQSPGVRVQRLSEALSVCKGLWRDGAFSFNGLHYQVNSLDGRPKPTQRPGPPILIGGGGSKVLNLAATEADIVGINPSMHAYEGRLTLDMVSPSAVDNKVAHVRSCAGERFKAIELNVLVMRTHLGGDWKTKREQMAGAFGASTDDIDASPYIWLGDTQRVIDHVAQIRERWGISYFAFHNIDAMEQMATVVSQLAGT